jgi:PAS domain S-box-containing protein
MDSMSINDLLFECIRAIVLIALLVTLFLRGSFTSLGRHPGWRFILTGFCLITAATLLDITDEIPGLEKYVIIGDTIYQAFLEKLPGYLLGFSLVLIGFFKMIPSLEKAEQSELACHESEERFRQIFVATPDPVILTRIDSGEIISVNPAFEKQSGFNRNETIGRNSSELDFWVAPEKRGEFRSRLQKERLIDNLETEFRTKGGIVHPALLSAQMVTIAGEACALIVIRDITSIKKADQALLEIDRIRSEFISTAAHELRTPLSVLIGYSELLTATDEGHEFSEEERLEFLEVIQQKGLVLSQIIDDLLDISRIDAGLKFGLTLKTINPDTLLKTAFEQFRFQASEHRFSLDLIQDQEIQIDCDSQRLLQVVENLLSNAVKYSPKESPIRLSSSVSADGYTFSVTDHGIGMTPEQSEKVFDKFYRVDSSNTAVGGLGLGMNIVKQIVDAHNGSITIDSTPNQGTCVTVHLPPKAA